MEESENFETPTLDQFMKFLQKIKDKKGGNLKVKFRIWGLFSPCGHEMDDCDATLGYIEEDSKIKNIHLGGGKYRKDIIPAQNIIISVRAKQSE